MNKDTRLKIIMNDKDVTRKELAAHLHLTRQALERYINGATPNVIYSIKIADYLGVDVKEIWND